MSDNYRHDDFAVLRTDSRFGGFEELEHKNQDTSKVGSHTSSLLNIGALIEKPLSPQIPDTQQSHRNQ